MGNMTQCRVNGKEINRLGGIEHLMGILSALINEYVYLPPIYENKEDPIESEVELELQLELELELVNVTLGALRDLACGNAPNRIQIGQYKHPSSDSTTSSTSSTSQTSTTSGIEIISYFIKRHAHQTWKDISKMELRSMTNALGVVRNITHSTPVNCQGLHEAGMTTVFINTLRSSNDEDEDDNSTKTTRTLPDVSKPWREACFRLAASLINMAEKCHDAVQECAKDEELIWLLIESWGGMKDGKAIPVLHLGLMAVLVERLKMGKDGAGTSIELLNMIHVIIEREEKRKRAAQERENARKKIKEIQ